MDVVLFIDCLMLPILPIDLRGISTVVDAICHQRNELHTAGKVDQLRQAKRLCYSAVEHFFALDHGVLLTSVSFTFVLGTCLQLVSALYVCPVRVSARLLL